MAIYTRKTTGELVPLKIPAIKGEKGNSAYQVAVDNGFIGDESNWLESLKGENGKSGVFVGNIDEAPADINIVIDNTTPDEYEEFITNAEYDYMGNKHTTLKDVNDSNIEHVLREVNTQKYEGSTISAARTYAKQIQDATIKGVTKYKDINTGEFFDEFEEGKELELVSVKKPSILTYNYIDSAYAYPKIKTECNVRVISSSFHMWDSGNGFYCKIPKDTMGFSIKMLRTSDAAQSSGNIRIFLTVTDRSSGNLEQSDQILGKNYIWFPQSNNNEFTALWDVDLSMHEGKNLVVSFRDMIVNSDNDFKFSVVPITSFSNIKNYNITFDKYSQITTLDNIELKGFDNTYDTLDFTKKYENFKKCIGSFKLRDLKLGNSAGATPEKVEGYLDFIAWCGANPVDSKANTRILVHGGDIKWTMVSNYELAWQNKEIEGLAFDYPYLRGRILKSRLETEDYEGIKKFLNELNPTIVSKLKTPIIKTINLSNTTLYSYDETTYCECSSKEGVKPILSIDIPTNLSALVSNQQLRIKELEEENKKIESEQDIIIDAQLSWFESTFLSNRDFKIPEYIQNLYALAYKRGLRIGKEDNKWQFTPETN